MTTSITSLQNPRIKQAVRLRERRARKQLGLFLIDGLREIERAVAAGIEVVELYVCGSLRDETIGRLEADARQAGAEILVVTANVFEKIAFGDRAEGAVAVARAPTGSLDTLQLPREPVIAVLEGVEKPGNVGAVLRTADAAGISAVIVADGGTDLYNPNTIRASLGAIFTVPVNAATSEQVLAWLRQNKFAMFAARVDGAVDYSQAALRPPAAIILGSEARGLSPIWHARDITPIKLPMFGTIDSLNVSTTAAVLFYEVLRQRRQQ